MGSASLTATPFQNALQEGLLQVEHELDHGAGPLREKPALVAVSGGRDSVALLHGLILVGFKNLIICHLNHSLRGEESDEDARFVRALARRLNLKCTISICDVQSEAKKRGLSIETTGREMRLDFFRRIGKRHRTSMVYLAHHADDQAETILGSLLRGASTGGISGMKPVTLMPGGLILLRPLLGLRRSDISAFLESLGESYREDSSNATLDYRRNRLRNEVMPLLNDVMGRDVAPLLQRFARQAARDDGCLQESVHTWINQSGAIQEDGSLRLSAELKALHPALLTRCLHWWLREHLGLPGIDNREIEDALSLIHNLKGPAKINLPQGRHLRRKAGRLWVEG